MGWTPITRDDQWKAELLQEIREIILLLRNMPSPEPVAQFICDKCNKEFQSAQGLGVHKRYCNG